MQPVIAFLSLLALSTALLGAHRNELLKTRRDQSRMAVLEFNPQDPGDYVRIVARDAARCIVQQTLRGAPRSERSPPASPGGPPAHRHTASVEEFVVEAGVMGYSVGRERGQLARGGRVEVPARVNHQFWNAGGDGRPLTVRVAFTPCAGAVEYFENLAGLSADAGGRRRVPALQVLALYAAHGVEPAAVPGPLWRAVAAVASPLAAARGYRATYAAYSPSAGGRGGLLW